MIADNEWIRNKYYEYFELDHGITFIKKFSWLLRLYKLTKWKRLGIFLCRLEKSALTVSMRFFGKDNIAYQPIITHHFKIIEHTFKKSPLPDLIPISEIRDVRGFNLFNAESFPCFGDNLITINSGICFHSHTLTRFLQPFFMHISKTTRLNGFMKRAFFNKFQKASVALICNDHSITFSSWFFIPEDDNLLAGIEQFIIAHELAHLMFRYYSYDDFNFNLYFSPNSLELIYSNEEVAADAAALLMLFFIKQYTTNSILTLYGPQFIFKILSCYEQSGLWRTQINHPSNTIRYEYLKKMISELELNELYRYYDMIVAIIWSKSKDSIKKKCEKVKKYRNKLLDICIELQHLT